MKRIMLGLGSAIFLMVVMLTAALWYLSGGPGKSSDNIKDYKDIFDLHTYSECEIFPKELPRGIVEAEFYYNHREAIFDPVYQIYLQCTYDEKTWEAEKERLENMVEYYGNDLLQVEEGTYSYPAYIVTESYSDGSFSYEYALLTGENEITYIAISFLDKDKVKFDKKYLPEDYNSPSD